MSNNKFHFEFKNRTPKIQDFFPSRSSNMVSRNLDNGSKNMENKIQIILPFSKTIKFNQSSYFLIFQQLLQGIGNLNPGCYEYTRKYQLVELQSSWHPSSYKNEQIYTWKCDVNAIQAFIFSLGLHKIFCCVSLFYSIKPHTHCVFILGQRKDIH